MCHTKVAINKTLVSVRCIQGWRTGWTLKDQVLPTGSYHARVHPAWTSHAAAWAPHFQGVHWSKVLFQHEENQFEVEQLETVYTAAQKPVKAVTCKIFQPNWGASFMWFKSGVYMCTYEISRRCFLNILPSLFSGSVSWLSPHLKIRPTISDLAMGPRNLLWQSHKHSSNKDHFQQSWG